MATTNQAIFVVAMLDLFVTMLDLFVTMLDLFVTMLDLFVTMLDLFVTVLDMFANQNPNPKSRYTFYTYICFPAFIDMASTL